jgi:DNA replication protein DnaC
MLDDLGMGNTEKSDEWLTDILNARIEKGLLTIITSNLHPTQLKNASDRCISRIMSHTHPLEVKNVTDWRVKLKPYMSETLI